MADVFEDADWFSIPIKKGEIFGNANSDEKPTSLQKSISALEMLLGRQSVSHVICWSTISGAAFIISLPVSIYFIAGIHLIHCRYPFISAAVSNISTIYFNRGAYLFHSDFIYFR